MLNCRTLRQLKIVFAPYLPSSKFFQIMIIINKILLLNKWLLVGGYFHIFQVRKMKPITSVMCHLLDSGTEVSLSQVNNDFQWAPRSLIKTVKHNFFFICPTLNMKHLCFFCLRLFYSTIKSPWKFMTLLCIKWRDTKF